MDARHMGGSGGKYRRAGYLREALGPWFVEGGAADGGQGRRACD